MDIYMPLSLAMACSCGYYATRLAVPCATCHLMPQWHLPEKQEEHEQAFVHCSNYVSNPKLYIGLLLLLIPFWQLPVPLLF